MRFVAKKRLTGWWWEWTAFVSAHGKQMGCGLFLIGAERRVERLQRDQQFRKIVTLFHGVTLPILQIRNQIIG